MLLRPILCLLLVGFCREAAAADFDASDWLRPVLTKAAPPPPSWSWTGFYVGAQVGGAVSSANFSDPFGASIYGDTVTSPVFLAGGRAGYNWQLPSQAWVIGVDADLNWLSSDGTNTCLAFSGLFVSANCEMRPDIMADLTARLGWAFGDGTRNLLYGKGGVALVHDQVSMTTNATADFVGLAPLTTNTGYTAFGWTVGAGIERAITQAWSLSIEYDYIGLDTQSVATPMGIVQTMPPKPIYFLTFADVSHINQGFQVAKLSLNYKLGADPWASWTPLQGVFPAKEPAAGFFSGWEMNVGARYFGGGAQFQKDLGDTTKQSLSNILASRLTYNATATSAELFGRIEAPQNIFLKGNIATGSISGGHMNDEDWVVFAGSVPYSNTISNPLTGNVGYATTDLGYDFFRNPSAYRFGAFIGYNYYKESEAAFGCQQLANKLSDCVPAIPSTVLGITEDDVWQSLRLGFGGAITIADRVTLDADIAYLPYVKFSGVDDHVLRGVTIQESGIGTGVQLEGVLSYRIDQRFSVGVGGRYWGLWATNDTIADFNGAPCPCQTQPARAQLFGAFVQASYKFIDDAERGATR